MPDLTPAQQRTAPTLHDVATGRVTHRHLGGCPDALDGFDRRDPECAACQALLAADQAQSATTLTDDERAALLTSIGWEWEPSDEECIPSPDDCAQDLYAEVDRIIAARHAPAADHTATLDRVRELLSKWGANENYARRIGQRGNLPIDRMNRREGNVWNVACADLRAALDGDTNGCGDPTRDNEHGGGA